MNFGAIFAVAAFFLLGALIVIAALQDALNKLEVDLTAYIEANRAKDAVIADQAAEITRLEANQADPAAIDAMTAQVNKLDGQLFV